MKNLDNAARLALAHSVHAALFAVNVKELEAVTFDRSIPRKQQAALLRKAFALLGVKGISVTTPNYSMAQSVHVFVPCRNDYKMDTLGYVIEGDEARAQNNKTLDRVREILAVLFPAHDNRSDSQTDYFDYCWSVAS